MGLVSPSQSNPNDTIEAADINNPINQLAAVINGGIDTNNITDAGIATADIADDAITAAKMQYGMLRQRQGGTTGAASWATAGTSNTDTSAVATFEQCGTIAVTANPTVVTFPVAFSQVPHVQLTMATAASANAFPIMIAVSTTTVSIRCVSDAGVVVTTESVNWTAKGQ